METASTSPARPPYLDVDFDRTPFTLAWEITRACALSCIHCRAEAIPQRDANELTTKEAFNVLDQIVDLGKPILVITGGDPMMRRDVFDILGGAVQRGLKVGFSPSATRLVTRAAIERVRDVGVDMVHVSLDGSCPEVHDTFRRVSGAYQRTREIAADVRARRAAAADRHHRQPSQHRRPAGHRRGRAADRRDRLERLLPRPHGPRPAGRDAHAGRARTGAAVACGPLGARTVPRPHDGRAALPPRADPARRRARPRRASSRKTSS